MDSALAASVSEVLGAPVVRHGRVAGGDVDLAFRVELGDRRRVFVKVARDRSSSRIAAEARGLGWLAAGAHGFAPKPLAVIDTHAALVLPWLERGAWTELAEERFGHELAKLHRAGANGFGAPGDGYLATIPVSNDTTSDWASFYGERRLLPLARRAEERGAIDAALRERVERLVPRLSERVGPPEPPARLHGDLWGGNAMVDASGAPHVFDPCAFGGHREIDLAMMRLFGGFSPRVFSAYAEAFPLAPGADERVELHQLLPLLAHCVLFGARWSSAVAGALDAARA